MRPTPSRRATATGALIAAAALLSVAVPASAAQTDAAAPALPAALASQAARTAHPGALPRALSPAQRAALISQAEAGTTAKARELGLGSLEKLAVRDVVQDIDGTTHTRYERTYDGLPVLGGDLVVESKAGTTESVTKASDAALKNVDTTAGVTPATAQKQALGAAAAEGSKSTSPDSAPRKVVWLAQGSPVLAYETVVGGLQEDGTPNQLHVITDATTGKKLFQYQGIETGIGNTEFSGQVTLGSTQSGSTYNLTDAGRGGHQTFTLKNTTSSGKGTLLSGPDDVWGDGTPTNQETPAADAAYGAGLTWDYYKNVHGRTGIKGNGVAAYSRVHYGNSYVNAFWDDSCFCMTYGDGAQNKAPLTAVDVAGHEMSHGVTAATAGLVYSGESGGLNEGTSDIFGTAVEWYANNANDPGDYLIGEKIDINGDGSPLRYMDKPSKDGGSADSWYSGVGNLDVHYSSGIANHFFYLLSEGSGAKVIGGVSYNSPTSDGLPVTGIGRAKAEQIWFKALSTKFTSTTNYAAARTGTLAAAGELYGTTSAEYTAVANAWAGVNVGTRPGGGGDPAPGDGTVFQNTTAVSIPDNGAAVTSSVDVTGISGKAPAALKVDVNITHTWRGDLVIDLVAPDGTTYRLKNSSASDSADNVIATYTVNASSVTANGTWKLKVQDVASGDTGRINSFKLTF
ncbi:M4 family metallopeptidase [Streptomyces sp. NPDC088725]|uniref:M4 family metallopeptidase n=1 Tax=Streptomyces sp. NPDC088725 TaxID=3365873 RepID=UPI003802C6EC